VRAACLVCAVAALGLGLYAAMGLYFAGFPDGHLTDYDDAVSAPKRLLQWAEFGLAGLLLVVAFVPMGTRARAVGLLVTVIALVLVVAAQLVGVPWYFGTHLGLDNGVGG
jgi:cell division protein FtsW (lipid II flippase)